MAKAANEIAIAAQSLLLSSPSPCISREILPEGGATIFFAESPGT
jgi:hypothetical protein